MARPSRGAAQGQNPLSPPRERVRACPGLDPGVRGNGRPRGGTAYKSETAQPTTHKSPNEPAKPRHPAPKPRHPRTTPPSSRTKAPSLLQRPRHPPATSFPRTRESRINKARLLRASMRKIHTRARPIPSIDVLTKTSPSPSPSHAIPQPHPGHSRVRGNPESTKHAFSALQPKLKTGQKRPQATVDILPAKQRQF